MTNAQEWLDREYPKEEREEITRLDISDKNKLEGNLIIENFSKLKKFKSGYTNITDLTISNCLELEEIEHPNPTNTLKLENLPKLKIINCCSDRLTKLEITNCPEIAHLDYSHSNCNNFNLSSLNPKKLTYLVTNGNLKLVSVAPFINLETLIIEREENESSCYENYYYDSYDREMSLEHLKDLTKLRHLEVSSDNISGDIEHLPKSVEDFQFNYYWVGQREGKINKLSLVLGGYNSNFKEWRKTQTYLIKQVKEEENTELYSRINNLEKIIANWENNFQQILATKEQIIEVNNKLERDLVQKTKTIHNLREELLPLKLEKVQKEYNNLLNINFEQGKLNRLMIIIERVIKEEKENDFFAQDSITERKEYFQDKLETGMINKLCQLKEETIKLELELQKLQLEPQQQIKIQVPPKQQ
jgi:hypothetical protein